MSLRLFPTSSCRLPESRASSNLLTFASSVVEWWRRKKSRCTRTPCPRWRASQSISTSLSAAVCETVAIYFRNLVLIDFGCRSVLLILFTLLETQSHPLTWSIDPFVARGKTNLFSFRMVSGRVFMSTSIADFVSGVSMMGTFLFLFPVISIRWSLRI